MSNHFHATAASLRCPLDRRLGRPNNQSEGNGIETSCSCCEALHGCSVCSQSFHWLGHFNFLYYCSCA